MTAKDVIRILRQNGWKLDRINGSHQIFVKESFPRSVVVPVHGNKDLGAFAYAILRQAGIDTGERRK